MIKLKELYLKNWGCYKEQQIDFNDINLFVGPNGSGKSTLIDAIRFGLTHKLERSPVNGKDSAEMLLRIEVGGSQIEISKKVTPSGAKEGYIRGKGGVLKGTIVEVSAELLRQLNLTEKMVASALDTGGFISLPEAEQKRIIFDVLGACVTRENLIDWLTARDPSTEFDSVISRFLGQEEPNHKFDDDNGPEWVGIRRALKRQLSDVENNLKHVGQTVMPTDAQIEQANNTLARLAAADKNESGDLPALQKRLEQIESDLDKRDLSNKIEAAQKKLAGLKQEYEDTSTGRADANKVAVQLIAVLDQMERDLDELSELGDQCPTCHQKVTDLVKQQIAEGIQTEIAEKEVERKQADKKLSDWDSLRANLNKRIVEAEAAFTALREDSFSGNRDDLKAEQRTLKAKIDLLSLPVDKEKADKDRIDAQGILSAREQAKKATELQAEAETIRREVAAVDLLCKAYEKDGVRAELVNKKIDEFNDFCTKVATPFSYIIKIITERDGKTVFEIEANDIPISRYSTGERMVILFALQISLASYTNIGVIVIDEFNVLSEGNQEVASRMLSQSRQRLETAIVLKASDYNPQPAKAEFASSFAVLNGQITKQ